MVCIKNRNKLFGGSKRGSLQDMIFIMSVVSVFIFTVMVTGFFVFKVNDKLQGQPGNIIDNDTKLASSKATGLWGGVLDSSSLVIFIILAIAVLCFASLVPVHPIFIIFYLVGLVFLIISGAAISNLFEKLAGHPEMAQIASKLVISSTIMQFLPWIIGIFGLILMVIIYKTWRTGGS